ncbi:unnamed protein product, partial [Brassica oleracea var. botrytis]
FCFPQSRLVHGSVSTLGHLRFRKRLTEGSVYSLSGFDVTRRNTKFWLSDSPVSIRFNSSLIQTSVYVHRLNTFRDLLREVTMNELNGFDVARSNNHFKICNCVVVTIRLNEFRKMVEVPAVANPIPTEMFRFRNVEQIMSLANTVFV